MPNNPPFFSVLSRPIEGFIAEKRSLGYRFDKAERGLKRFDVFVSQQSVTECRLTKQLVLDWAVRQPHETVATQSGRISLLRGLAEYMSRMGYVAYVYPRGMVEVERYAYVPYLFSNDELKRMFEICDRYPPSESSPDRHLILPILLRMLYGCGLRISEALHLTIQDVNLEEGQLVIRNTKFNKERIVPMADSLVKRCLTYVERVGLGKRGNRYFFPSPYGGHYNESTIYHLFRGILRQAGITHMGRGRGPRVHDVRHTHAVHCLRNWVLEGKDLNNYLPYLSAYLGHEDLRGSQRYLRLTADLYPDITKKIEQICASMIPEVENDQAD